MAEQSRMNFTTLISLALLLLLSTLVLVQKLFSKPRKLPPGPKPLPIIGNLLDLGAQPHQSLAELSITHGPLMTLKLGTMTTIVASSSDMAKQLLQKYDHLFCNRLVPDVGHVIDHDKFSVGWLPISPEWRWLRKVIATFISGTKPLEASQALRHEQVKKLIEFVRETCRNGNDEPIDIGLVAFITTLNFLSNTLFSLDFAQYQTHSFQEFRYHVEQISELVGAPNVADFFPGLKYIDPQNIRKRIQVHFKKLHSSFSDIINERVKFRSLCQENMNNRIRNDVLDDLLNVPKDNANATQMDSNDISHLLIDMFSAGTHTSSSSVEWIMTELMRNPEKMAKAQAELDKIISKENGQEFIQESDIQKLPYLQAVVKETFRLHPPAPLLVPHKAETDVEIDGYTVPKGSQVWVNVWAIGRDSNTWTNPLSFEPERFLGDHREIDYKGRDFELIPFGAGRRICPGLGLAHRMVHLMVASLLRSFDWKLENGMKPEDIAMNEKFGLALQKAVPLKAIPVMKFVV